jgi:hypothetical protein
LSDEHSTLGGGVPAGHRQEGRHQAADRNRFGHGPPL